MLYEIKQFFHGITKGEILIVCIAFIIWSTMAVFINMAISNSVTKSNEVYYKAVQIEEDEELFAYAMKTNAGNALVYGTVDCIDTVTCEQLKGEYLAIKVQIEEYVRKMKTEDVKDSEGNTVGTKVVYYEEWDPYNTQVFHTNTVSFLGKEFSYSKLKVSNYKRLNLNAATVNSQYAGKISGMYLYPSGKLFTSVGDLRYSFSVIPCEQKVTILADLRDNNIYSVGSENGSVAIYYNTNIASVIKSIEDTKNLPNIIFTIIWYVVFVVLACVFVAARNRWIDC